MNTDHAKTTPMKKYLLLILSVCLTVMTACDDKDDENIDFTLVITDVQDPLGYASGDGDHEVGVVLVKGSMDNPKILELAVMPYNAEKMTVPLKRVPDGWLISINESFGSDFNEISNRKARWSGHLRIYHILNGYLPVFGGNLLLYATQEGYDGVHVYYCYVDRDVTIKGVYSGEGFSLSYDLGFVRGWNAYAYAYKHNDETNEMVYTSALPSGARWRL